MTSPRNDGYRNGVLFFERANHPPAAIGRDSLSGNLFPPLALPHWTKRRDDRRTRRRGVRPHCLLKHCLLKKRPQQKLMPRSRGAGGGSRLGASKGGATGIRTPDLLHAMQALYRLSYGPMSGIGEDKRADLHPSGPSFKFVHLNTSFHYFRRTGAFPCGRSRISFHRICPRIGADVSRGRSRVTRQIGDPYGPPVSLALSLFLL